MTNLELLLQQSKKLKIYKRFIYLWCYIYTHISNGALLPAYLTLCLCIYIFKVFHQEWWFSFIISYSSVFIIPTIKMSSYFFRHLCSYSNVFFQSGIPAHHQNLLFQMTELEDHKTLDELGITNGSTLKLVLSMRGGPISTRRLTYEHHLAWKDVKELIEHARYCPL